MKLKDIGEFALIERLSKIIGKTSGSVVLGIGDDAAALQMTNVKSFDRAQDGWNGELVEPCQMLPSDRARSLSSGRGRTEVLQHEVSNECKYLLITTDALIENVHFKLDKKNGRSPFFNLGCKALAINISDVAAMGGIPTYALVTIGANKNLSVRKIENLYRGINKLAKKHKIQIIGGDTVSSPKELIISITLLGEVEKENLLTRSGARVGNLILVTGSFGGSAAKKYVPSSFALRASEDKRLPSLVPRIREARLVAKSGKATSMIDSSDGLVRSIIEVCKASKVGARINLAGVPIAKRATLSQALYGGEEYELVFTAPAAKAVKLANLIKKKTGTTVTIVGKIVEKKKGVKLVDSQGRLSIPRKGYEHFV